MKIQLPQQVQQDFAGFLSKVTLCNQGYSKTKEHHPVEHLAKYELARGDVILHTRWEYDDAQDLAIVENCSARGIPEGTGWFHVAPYFRSIRGFFGGPQDYDRLIEVPFLFTDFVKDVLCQGYLKRTTLDGKDASYYVGDYLVWLFRETNNVVFRQKLLTTVAEHVGYAVQLNYDPFPKFALLRDSTTIKKFLDQYAEAVTGLLALKKMLQWRQEGVEVSTEELEPTLEQIVRDLSETTLFNISKELSHKGACIPRATDIQGSKDMFIGMMQIYTR